jgi:hypothetical protein
MADSSSVGDMSGQKNMAAPAKKLPNKVAALVAFVASPLSSATNGAALRHAMHAI